MTNTALARLRAWLDQQHLMAGGPLPSERDLAAILGCSRHQIRLAMTILEGENVVSSVDGRARVATAGPSLRERDFTRTVVLIAAPGDVPAPGGAVSDGLDLYPRVHHALMAELSGRGFDLLTLPVGATALDHACQVILQRPAGVVLLFTAIRDPGGRAVLDSARRASVPTVICGDELTAEELALCGVDVVGFDHATAVADLVGWAAARGWRSPLCLSEWAPLRPHATWMDEQARGFAAGCVAHGCHHRPPQQVHLLPAGPERDWHQARILAGYLAEHQRGPDPCDVLLAASDGLVPDLHRACTVLGINLPILGYDDWLHHHHDAACLRAPGCAPLVTTAHDAEALATHVGELLTQPTPGTPRQRLAPLRLIVGQATT